MKLLIKITPEKNRVPYGGGRQTQHKEKRGIGK